MENKEQTKVDLKEVKVTVDGVWLNNIITQLGEVPAKYSRDFIEYFEKVLSDAINTKYAPKEEVTEKKDLEKLEG